MAPAMHSTVVALVLVALAVNLAPAALADDFAALVRRVGRIDNPEPLPPSLDPALAKQVSDDAVARRKRLVVRAGSVAEFRHWARNPVTQYPVAMCRLALDPKDEQAMAYIPKGLERRGQGDTFGRSSLSRVFCQFGAILEPHVIEAIHHEALTYPGWLSGGTENHVAMRRTAGFLLGERFPDEKWHFGLTGRQVAGECRRYMRDYGHAIYDSSMVEYLSPAYHAVNTATWLNVADFAKDPAARLMARAILDWMFTDLAANWHSGIVLPPLQRDKGMLKDSYQLTRCRTLTQWSGWLYWGGGNTPQHDAAFTDGRLPPEMLPNWMAMLHALASWTPHPAIRHLGAKRLATPYMLWQSRGNWPCIEPSHLNPYGKTRAAHDDPADPRYNLRSVYVARRYAMGASYRREDIMDPITRHATPFSVVWQSPRDRNWLIVSHPYWYTARKKEGADEPLGDDDWVGTSPFCQMAHWENAAVLLFDIPARDPYGAKAGKGSRLFRSERTAECVQAVFVYVPESVEEIVDRANAFFLREGDVYVAIRPLRPGARWEEAAYPGWRRLAMRGGLVGCAIEVADKQEHGSFEAFQRRIAAARLDLSRLDSGRCVQYESSRGHRIDLTHNSDGWLPKVAVNGVPLRFEQWPACESPYLTCRGRVLDVNDGREGFRVDWTDEVPVYTYYDIAEGVKRPKRREWAEGGQLRVESLGE